MSEKAISAGVTILIAIVGVAALAVLLSKSAKTSTVLSASSTGFAQMLCAALGPIGGCGIPFVNSNVTFGNTIPTSIQ